MTLLTSMLGLIACLAAILLVVGVVGFVTLVKAGIIVRHAVKPIPEDRGNYTLSQGREVRPESELQESHR